MKNSLLRIAAVVGVCAMLLLAAVFAPLLLRRIDALNVTRVEVTGIQYMSAEDAVAASGITRASNVFDDPAAWIEKLEKHPLVASATIERRLPGALVIRITEVMPVAFARTPELRAIDEHGTVLPASPALHDMDLPVLTVATRLGADGTAVDEETKQIAAFVATVMRNEPALLGWISEVGMRGDAVQLILRNAADAEVLVTADPTPERLTELHLTLVNLAQPSVLVAEGDTTSRDVGPDLSRVTRIDGRFRDQIVVALERGTS